MNRTSVTKKMDREQLASMTVNAGMGNMDPNENFHIDVSELKQKGTTAF